MAKPYKSKQKFSTGYDTRAFCLFHFGGPSSHSCSSTFRCQWFLTKPRKAICMLFQAQNFSHLAFMDQHLAFVASHLAPVALYFALDALLFAFIAQHSAFIAVPLAPVAFHPFYLSPNIQWRASPCLQQVRLQVLKVVRFKLFSSQRQEC